IVYRLNDNSERLKALEELCESMQKDSNNIAGLIYDELSSNDKGPTGLDELEEIYQFNRQGTELRVTELIARKALYESQLYLGSIMTSDELEEKIKSAIYGTDIIYYKSIPLKIIPMEKRPKTTSNLNDFKK